MSSLFPAPHAGGWGYQNSEEKDMTRNQRKRRRDELLRLAALILLVLVLAALLLPTVAR